MASGLWALPGGLVFPGCPLANLSSLLLHQGLTAYCACGYVHFMTKRQEGTDFKLGKAATNAPTLSPHSTGLYY